MIYALKSFNYSISSDNMTLLGIGKCVITTDCHINHDFQCKKVLFVTQNCHISKCHIDLCHIIRYLQSGASYLSQGFEDNVLRSSPADWLIL